MLAVRLPGRRLGRRHPGPEIHLGHQIASHHLASKVHFHNSRNRLQMADFVHMGRSYYNTNLYPLSKCFPCNVCNAPNSVLVGAQSFDLFFKLAGNVIDLCEIHCFDIDCLKLVTQFFCMS